MHAAKKYYVKMEVLVWNTRYCVALYQGANKGDHGSARTSLRNDVPELFRRVLITSYFTINVQFYGQTDGVAMDSLFSPVIANFYMEGYKKAEYRPP
jgi:hypothetical protein